MGSNKKKILVSVDASDRSHETVRYVSKIPLFQKMEVVLFNVFHKIPGAYWDLETAVWSRGKGPAFGWRIKDVRAWEIQRQKAIQDFMQKAGKLFLDAGFSKDTIKVKIHEMEKGIARDIINEARRGYQAIAVGRRGMSKVRDLILGSIATKLLEKVTFAPFLLIGKNSSPEKVLVALDGSGNSMRAVDYVGACLGGSDFKLNLVHIIRGDEKQYTEHAKEIITATFNDAKNRLQKSGFKSNQMTTRIITGVKSRAEAIVGEARQSGYSTIVVGRRGLSKVEEFSIGRVSNKVVYLAKGLAVWVIN